MECRLRRVHKTWPELKETKMVRACAQIMPGRHPSEVVKYLRIGEGLTVKQVAHRLNVSMVTVVRWTPPSIVGIMHHTPERQAAEMRNLEKAWKAQRNGKINKTFVR